MFAQNAAIIHDEFLHRLKKKVSDYSAYNDHDLDSMLTCLRRSSKDVFGSLRSYDADLKVGVFKEQDCDHAKIDMNVLQDLRFVYIQQLKSAYQKQFEKGGLGESETYLAHVVQHLLDIAADGVSNGESISDLKLIRFTVKLTMAMIELHRIAHEQFSIKFSAKYPAEASLVIQEFEDQVLLAKGRISSTNQLTGLPTINNPFPKIASAPTIHSTNANSS